MACIQVVKASAGQKGRRAVYIAAVRAVVGGKQENSLGCGCVKQVAGRG